MVYLCELVLALPEARIMGRVVGYHWLLALTGHASWSSEEKCTASA